MLVSGPTERTSIRALALVAERDADHRAAIDRRNLDLVRRLEVRVEAAIGVDARVEDEAEIGRAVEDPIDELPRHLRDAVLPSLGIEEVFAPCATEMLVWAPLPLMPTTGFGRNDAVMSIRAAIWRQSNL